MTPFDIITSRLQRASKPFTSKAGTSIRACCPACAGGNRTKLVVTEKPGGQVLIHCFSGCDPLNILNAVGLDFADLFADQKRSRPLRADARHDRHMLVGIVIEIIGEVEFLLLRHASQPVPGIAGMLAENVAELSQIKEFLKKESK